MIRWWLVAAACVLVPWLAQPPLAWWPIGLVSIVPYLWAAGQVQVDRRKYGVLYLGATLYWALTLQGLRHAHPAMYVCWIALAAYLACYRILFVVSLRRASRFGIPTFLAAPTLWVGMECVRNYLLTGVSAAMLGHTLAEVPSMIQIADIGGSYAVSFVVAMVNVAIFEVFRAALGSRTAEPKTALPIVSAGSAILLVAITIAYGRYRLRQPLGEPKCTFALIGRDEPIEYFQDATRELEIFESYQHQSIETALSHDGPIDVIVWPESMFTGTLPWTVGNGNTDEAAEYGYEPSEVRAILDERRAAFQFRASSLQRRAAKGHVAGPDLLVGCGVVDYGERETRAYSGLIHIGKQGAVVTWYAKNHLVMFGEYIPLVRSIPVVRDWIPKEIGISNGDGPEFFRVRGTTVAPNICIESAVERVTINHLRQLRQSEAIPEAIVNVTNDAWFDDSSVVQHHKRCTQLVAVACRRPILMAANNGPTCWIDSRGVIVDEIAQGNAGSVIARPRIDPRVSVVVSIADWPARVCAALFVLSLIRRWPRRVGSGDPPGPTAT